MLFPISRWFQKHVTVDRIDQHFARHSSRIMMGLFVDPCFRSLAASLLLTEGRGKYLTVRHHASQRCEVPTALSQDLQQFAKLSDHDSVPRGNIDAALSDLAACQSDLINQLKCAAGKYVDRVLAVTVWDSGIANRDFDGALPWRSACDSAPTAESTGMNVISDLPVADRCAGGTGHPLAALPLWLQLADRRSPRAMESRAVIALGRDCHCFRLPGSDGLDEWIPNIGYLHIAGNSLMEFISQFHPSGTDCSNPVELAVDGLFRESIAEILRPECDLTNRAARKTTDSDQWLMETPTAKKQANEFSLADWVRTAIVCLAEPISEWINNNFDEPLPLHTVSIVGNEPWGSLLSNELQRQFEQCGAEVAVRFAPEMWHDCWESLVAALLGLMHIDQIPANVPSITGADGLRILGRLTPGRLATWRHLLVNMTDTQSPTMRLRDAV